MNNFTAAFRTVRWILKMKNEMAPHIAVCILWGDSKFWAQPVCSKEEMYQLQRKYTFIKTFR